MEKKVSLPMMTGASLSSVTAYTQASKSCRKGKIQVKRGSSGEEEKKREERESICSLRS